METDLTIAYYQQDIVWEDPEANFRKAEEAFAHVGRKMDIMVVPETFNTGFSDNMAAMAERPEGPAFQFALRMARKHDALFVGTWTVADTAEDGAAGIFNRLHWVRPDGTYGTYDKGHTFRMSSEARQLRRGNSREVFEWRGWRIKPAICYDLRFPRWLRNSVAPSDRLPGTPYDRLRNCEQIDKATNDLDIPLDYDLLLICANWPATRRDAWQTLLKARAIENVCYVVGVNRSGTDGVGIPYSGDSAAIDCKGMAINSCQPDADQVRTATLSRHQLATFRRHWPFFLDFDE